MSSFKQKQCLKYFAKTAFLSEAALSRSHSCSCPENLGIHQVGLQMKVNR